MTLSARQISPETHFDSDLIGEADHRIANSLSLISSLVRLRAREAANQSDPAAFLAEIASRIEIVAELHRMIAASPTQYVSLEAYLNDMCRNLSSAIGARETTFSVAFDCKRQFPGSVALSFGLITAELFSNALKYAHPAGEPLKIAIACKDTPEGFLFVFQDNGVGLPGCFSFDSAQAGMGMRFIRALSQKLGAEPKWTNDEHGLRFEILALR